MTHNKVYEQFKSYFPQYAERVTLWFPNGKNSIRVRIGNGNFEGNPDLVFTYNGKKNWIFETVDSHIKHMKGEKQNGH